MENTTVAAGDSPAVVAPTDTTVTATPATPQSFLQELINGVKNLETDFLNLVEKHNSFVTDVQTKLQNVGVTLNADAHLYQGNTKNLFERLITSLESGFTDGLHAVESFFGLGSSAPAAVAVAPTAPTEVAAPAAPAADLVTTPVETISTVNAGTPPALQ